MEAHQLSLTALLAGASSLAAGFASLRRHRQIRDVPTSRIRSMAAGPVELVGRADPEPTLVSPWTGRPCAWWSWAVDEHRSGRNPWREIARGDSSACPLELLDDSGAVCVDLTGIDVTPTHTAVGAVRAGDRRAAALLAAGGVRGTRRLRIRESRIEAGRSVLVHGVVRVGTHAAPTQFRVASLRRAAERLASLAASPAAADPRALRPALARRLRALKRAARAEGAELGETELRELARSAREQVDTEHRAVRDALGRVEALAGSETAKAESAQPLLAALTLRVPEVPDAGPVVGEDPLGQSGAFLLPGCEERALRATRFGLAGIGAGVALIAAGLLGLALA